LDTTEVTVRQETIYGLAIGTMHRLVSAGASTSFGWATAALRWMMQPKGIPAGQRKWSGLAAVLNHKPTKVLRRLTTSDPLASRRPNTQSLWICIRIQKLAAIAKDNEVRGKPLQ